MVDSSTYAEIVAACNRFQRDRRIEPLCGLIREARLCDCGFRSLEVTREMIWKAYLGCEKEDKWQLRQIVDQLDELDMLRQTDVQNDFRAVSVHESECLEVVRHSQTSISQRSLLPRGWKITH